MKYEHDYFPDIKELSTEDIVNIIHDFQTNNKRHESAILVLTTRMTGLIQEYRKFNKLTDDSITLTENIIIEVNNALKE